MNLAKVFFVFYWDSYFMSCKMDDLSYKMRGLEIDWIEHWEE